MSSQQVWRFYRFRIYALAYSLFLITPTTAPRRQGPTSKYLFGSRQRSRVVSFYRGDDTLRERRLHFRGVERNDDLIPIFPGTILDRRAVLEHRHRGRRRRITAIMFPDRH